MKKRYYKVGDMVLIIGIWDTENNIAIVLKDFEYFETLRQWQTNAEKNELTRKGFIQYLFDNEFIKELSVNTFPMEDDF